MDVKSTIIIEAEQDLPPGSERKGAGDVCEGIARSTAERRQKNPMRTGPCKNKETHTNMHNLKTYFL